MRKVEAAVAGASYGKGAYSIWAKRQSSRPIKRVAGRVLSHFLRSRGSRVNDRILLGLFHKPFRSHSKWQGRWCMNGESCQSAWLSSASTPRFVAASLSGSSLCLPPILARIDINLDGESQRTVYGRVLYTGEYCLFGKTRRTYTIGPSFVPRLKLL